MGVGGVRPGLDRFSRAEIEHCSARTRITKLFLRGRTVIRKEPLGPDAERRVRHEVAMLERLAGVAGVAQLAQAPGHVRQSPCGWASMTSRRDCRRRRGWPDVMTKWRRWVRRSPMRGRAGAAGCWWPVRPGWARRP